MAEKAPANAPEQATPASELQKALDLYRKRENRDLLEGVRFDDKNIPGNKIIVVSETEIYSVPQDKIDPEGAEDGRPHRVWIEKGTKVWRSQEITLELAGEATVTHKELPSAIDQHLSSRFDLSTLTQARALVTAAAARQPNGTEQCLLSFPNYARYRLKPADLDQPLRTVFGGFDNPLISPLWVDWAAPCLESRPDLGDYLTTVYNPDLPVNTLRDFVKVFGRK